MAGLHRRADPPDPFRSLAALPLHVAGRHVGALDLFSTDPHLSERVDLIGFKEQIGPPLVALLELCLAQISDDDHAPLPDWYLTAVGRHHHVGVAVGMVMAAAGETSSNALSLLRGYAYAHDHTLDELADDLVHHHRPAIDITTSA